MKKNKEILIIDDEVDFRLSVAELLVDEGYSVSTASNGHEALLILRTAQKFPDLITIDMDMPLKDGAAFREEMQKLNPSIPMIMITGLFPEQISKLKGVKAFFLKPLDKLEFLNVVENYFAFNS